MSLHIHREYVIFSERSKMDMNHSVCLCRGYNKLIHKKPLIFVFVWVASIVTIGCTSTPKSASTVSDGKERCKGSWGGLSKQPRFVYFEGEKVVSCDCLENGLTFAREHWGLMNEELLVQERWVPYNGSYYVIKRAKRQ